MKRARVPTRWTCGGAVAFAAASCTDAPPVAPVVDGPAEGALLSIARLDVAVQGDRSHRFFVDGVRVPGPAIDLQGQAEGPHQLRVTADVDGAPPTDRRFVLDLTGPELALAASHAVFGPGCEPKRAARVLVGGRDVTAFQPEVAGGARLVQREPTAETGAAAWWMHLEAERPVTPGPWAVGFTSVDAAGHTGTLTAPLRVSTIRWNILAPGPLAELGVVEAGDSLLLRTPDRVALVDAQGGTGATLDASGGVILGVAGSRAGGGVVRVARPGSPQKGSVATLGPMPAADGDEAAWPLAAVVDGRGALWTAWRTKAAAELRTGARGVAPVKLRAEPAELVPYAAGVLVRYDDALEARGPSGELEWTVEAERQSRVSTAGDVVAVAAGDDLRLLGSSDGRERALVPLDGGAFALDEGGVTIWRGLTARRHGVDGRPLWATTLTADTVLADDLSAAWRGATVQVLRGDAVRELTLPAEPAAVMARGRCVLAVTLNAPRVLVYGPDAAPVWTEPVADLEAVSVARLVGDTVLLQGRPAARPTEVRLVRLGL